jgi:DNA-binding MarR family transcriptional regulator
LRALLFLYQRRDRITIVTDLARQLKRTTAATTGTCDRLVKKGFITRTHTDEDRRKLILTITSEGITALKSILSK